MAKRVVKALGHSFDENLACTWCREATWHRHQLEPEPCVYAGNRLSRPKERRDRPGQ